MKRLAAFCCAWLAAGAYSLPVPAQPAPPQTAPPQTAAISPIPPSAEQSIAVATDPSTRLGVPVSIGGRPWNFLIDTASTRSVIARDVADSLDLAKGDALQIL